MQSKHAHTYYIFKMSPKCVIRPMHTSRATQQVTKLHVESTRIWRSRIADEQKHSWRIHGAMEITSWVIFLATEQHCLSEALEI